MKRISIILFLLYFAGGLHAQTLPAKATKGTLAWTDHDPFKTDVFIENLGQFDTWAQTPFPVKYALNNSNRIFFNQQGLTFKLIEIEKGTEQEREEREHAEKRSNAKSYYVNMTWEGCNS